MPINAFTTEPNGTAEGPISFRLVAGKTPGVDWQTECYQTMVAVWWGIAIRWSVLPSRRHPLRSPGDYSPLRRIGASAGWYDWLLADHPGGTIMSNTPASKHRPCLPG